MKQNEKCYNYALKYVDKGMSLYPVDDNTKQCPFRWGKFQKRLPSKKELKIWFLDFKYESFALVTGKISNLIVIDCDDDAGINVWKDICCNKFQDKGSIETTSVKTKRGMHFYYRYPNGIEIPSKPDFFGKFISVEIKSDGNSIKAPPSLYTDKSGEYFFNSKHDISNFPEWLLNEFEILESKREIRKEYINKDVKKDGEKWLKEAINKGFVGNRNNACV